MSNSEVEDKLIELESEMLLLNLDDVSRLAQGMKLDECNVQDKSKFAILKVIRQTVEEKIAGLTGKADILKYSENIKAFIGPPPLEQVTE